MVRLRYEIENEIKNAYWYSRTQDLWGSTGLEKVVIQCSNGSCVLDSQSEKGENERMVELFVAVVTNVVGSIIQFHVYTKGWRKTKKLWRRLSSTEAKA